jgi:hopene-associated glycosyltransferase HpnB
MLGFVEGWGGLGKDMDYMLSVVIGAASLAIWAYLILARGGFWRCGPRDTHEPVPPPVWPAVAAIIPARDEAEHVGKNIASLLRQDYPGPLTVILVDDDSADGTKEAAERIAASLSTGHRFVAIRGRGLPPGWTGKLWAVKQGVAEALSERPTYLLLTDADIVHAPGNLRWLVAHAQAGSFVLVSLMAQLRCESLAERSHNPAFIFFFQMLYPFSWANRADRTTAAAAGGCMLVRADTLSEAGGIASIRNALIDDCALAQRLKRHGPIWIGLTERVRSVRAYGWNDVRCMVSRSAYTQLGYSPLALVLTMAGMGLTYVAPVLLAIGGSGPARWLGFLSWALMALAFQPSLRFYRSSPLWGVALPFIALLYMLYTLDSGYQHARGRGGIWKGRAQAGAPGR